MRDISDNDIKTRLVQDNPWWGSHPSIAPHFADMPRRSYFGDFIDLVAQKQVNRAVILMGPRRVGKTVMVYHAIQQLLDGGLKPNQILYASLETPVYADLRLDQMLSLFIRMHNHGVNQPLYLFFDEIQYHPDWEVHLKSLVDSYPAYRFVATGSAAAALKLKSRESGAGRFTEFMLPPLTFYEFIKFDSPHSNLVIEQSSDHGPIYSVTDIDRLNDAFLDYLAYGAYPEAVFNPAVRDDVQRFIKDDVVEKVLLRDLPTLYGISNIQEINRLLTVLAYNSGDELSLEQLSKRSGVTKATLERYLTYLEAAFLIQRMDRVDLNAHRFKRRTRFKAYLTNPSMRAALFGALKADDQDMGNLVETAIYAQWFHSHDIGNLHYARWQSGEIDLVSLDQRHQKPRWAAEIKWSDTPLRDRRLLRNAINFARKNRITAPVVFTTRTQHARQNHDGIEFLFVPSALYAYVISAGILTAQLTNHIT